MIFRPINNAPFGATVVHYDCAFPDKTAADEIRLALHQHQLLVFPEQQHLTPQQEVVFYRSIDLKGVDVWRDQSSNPWEVFKVAQGNKAGTYQIPQEPGVLVLGKGDINHFGLKVTLGGERGAYGEDQGSQVLGGGALQWHIDGTFYGYAPCHYTHKCVASNPLAVAVTGLPMKMKAKISYGVRPDPPPLPVAAWHLTCCHLQQNN